MEGRQQQRLLPTHRAAERVDPTAVDVDAVRLGDLRHARQVGDLSRIAPGVPVQAAPLAGRVDHGEVALSRQVTPKERVLAGPDATSVRRDDERHCFVGQVDRGQKPGGAPHAVVRDVMDEPCLGTTEPLRRRQLRARRRHDDQSGDQHEQLSHRRNGTRATAKMALWMSCG